MKRLQSLACVCGLLAAACAGGSLEQLRAATYPPDFHYIAKHEIHTTMGALASQMDALDRIMSKDEGPDSDDHAPVVEILSSMRKLAVQLKKREHSNHPQINEHAIDLQRDIERALAATRKQPPNYYYTGLVSGACAYCHAPRHRSRRSEKLALP